MTGQQKLYLVVLGSLCFLSYIFIFQTDDKVEQLSEDKKTIKRQSFQVISSSGSMDHPVSDQVLIKPNALESERSISKELEMDRKKYRQYPPNFSSFNEQVDDHILDKFAITKRFSKNPYNPSKSMLIWADQTVYHKGDTIRLFTQVTEQDHRISASLEGTITFDNSFTVKNASFSDSNNDYVYRYTIEVNELLGEKPLFGIYQVNIRYKDPSNNKDYDIYDSVSFMITDVGASITGNITESAQSESLRFEVEVDVSISDKYRLQGSLYTKDERPIGTVSVVSKLSEGKQIIALDYYGKILYDIRFNGPYILKYLHLSRLTMPMMLGPKYNANYETQPYSYLDFTKEAYKGFDR